MEPERDMKIFSFFTFSNESHFSFSTRSFPASSHLESHQVDELQVCWSREPSKTRTGP